MLQKKFLDYYCSQFGRRDFVIPLIFLGSTSAIALYMAIDSICDAGTATSLIHYFDTLCRLAVAGAYMYCLGDLIERWDSRDVSPSDLLWLAFRFVIAIPAALAVSKLFNSEIAPAIGFLMGMFPTHSLKVVLFRLGAKTLGQGDLPESGDSEVTKLAGIDVIMASKLAGQGITTVVQLAYADPVKLAIRCNKSFSVVIDYAGQALLWIYVKDNYASFAKTGLRGAYEVRDLWVAAHHCDPADEKAAARKVWATELIRTTAGILSYDVEVLKGILVRVAEDPYTKFLWTSWHESTNQSGGPLSTF